MRWQTSASVWSLRTISGHVGRRPAQRLTMTGLCARWMKAPMTGPSKVRGVTSDILSSGERADIYRTLLYAATQHGSSLIGDAERAAARGCEPSPEPWAREVHDAVGATVPELLARWPDEPPLIRLYLATLAALYPEPGQAARDQVAEMSRLHAGTDAAALLDLVAALIARDEQGATQAAEFLAAGIHGLDRHPLDAANLPVAVRATRLLIAAALRIAARRR